MNKKIVAVDMDDTILWLMKAIMNDHNEKHPETPVLYEQMIAFDDSMLHPDYDKMEFFNRPGTFYHLEPMDDHVVSELEKIHNEYDLVVVTSAFPSSVSDKWDWIKKHLPFIPHENFFTGARKDLIQADILIDDAKHNVEKWVQKGKPAIVPSHHWNQQLAQLDGVHMMYGWHGMKEIIDSILR